MSHMSDAQLQPVEGRSAGLIGQQARTRRRRLRSGTLDYHLMLLPGIVLLILFGLVPMFGLVLAFQNFQPELGVFRSPWVGLDNFTSFLFVDPEIGQIFLNTVIIAVSEILLGLLVPLAFALLLNELCVAWYKSTAQTIVYLPHFLSWVILGGIFLQIFSLGGIVNQALHIFGVQPIFFMQSNTWFRPIVIGTDTWKEFGFSTIVYLATLTGINPSLYEASAIDGASRWQSLIHVTLPGLIPTIVLLATLALGNTLNANFDQIYNMYNPTVYQTGDIIDTWVYREGLGGGQFSIGVAVSMLKEVIGFVLIIVSYRLAARFANYRIF